MNSRAAFDKTSFILLCLALLALIGLYLPFFTTLVRDWEHNANYSHGYFIPLISLFMVYTLRFRLKKEAFSGSWWGGVLLILGLSLLLAGKIGSEFFVQRISFLVCLLGIVLFLAGKRIAAIVLLPIAYLFFMIPLPAIIWNKLAFPLQLFGSALTEKVIRLLGIPVFREGNVLHLVETSLEVVAACSGLRSLVTMFALAALLAFLARMPMWKRLLLFFSAAPVAIVANIIRLSTTALLASKYGGSVAQGFLHDFSGMVVFAIGLGLLFAVNALLGAAVWQEKSNSISR